MKSKSFQVIVHLTSCEYLDEVVHATQILIENKLFITDTYIAENKQFIELTISSSPKATVFRCMMLINHWAGKNSEAIQEIEILQLDEEAIKLNIGDNQQQIDNENKYIELDGGYGQKQRYANNPQALQYREKLKELLNRDGDKCVLCNGKLNPNTMDGFKIQKHNIPSSLEEKFDFIVGICYFCNYHSCNNIYSLASNLWLKWDKQERQNKGKNINFKLLQQRIDNVLDKQYENIDIQELLICKQMIEYMEQQKHQEFDNLLKDYFMRRKFSKRVHKLQKIADRDESQECCWCGQSFDVNNPPTIEHILPKSISKFNHPSNYMLACQECNNQRGKDKISVWLEYCHKHNKKVNIQALMLRLSDLSQNQRQNIADIANTELEQVLQFYLSH